MSILRRGDEWLRGSFSDWQNEPQSEWIGSVIDLTRRYPNLYTDISCFNLDNKLLNDKEHCVRDSFGMMLKWIRDDENYKHLRHKIIFGTDWYLTHLTRSDSGAAYGNYCRAFKRLLDSIDESFWVQFTMINPWKFYGMSKVKVDNIASALKLAGADEAALTEKVNQLRAVDKEVNK